MEDVQPSTTQGALAACRDSFVGEGKLLAKVLLTQQSPFPSSGRIVAFNGVWKGKPAILAHVYGTKPVPTSFTMPFVISTLGKGTYGTQLHATLPHFSGKWGYITGISLNLGATSHSHGHKRSLHLRCLPGAQGLWQGLFLLDRSKALLRRAWAGVADLAAQLWGAVNFTVRAEKTQHEARTRTTKAT